MNRTKFLSAADAARLVKSGDTVAVSGNGAGMTSAEAILAAIEARFLETGEPRDLTLVHSLGLGDRDRQGTNRFAHEGMLRKVIASHFTWSARMQQLIRDEKIEAYCFPGGVVQQLLREIGAGRPGLITHSGLGPSSIRGRMQDAAIKGARRRWSNCCTSMAANSSATSRSRSTSPSSAAPMPTREAISALKKRQSISIFIRWLWPRTTAAESCWRRFARCSKPGTLKARSIRVPGIMVDVVVEDAGQELFYGLPYDPTISGSQRADLEGLSTELPKKLERRIIARRAAMELRHNASLNFGFGIPGGIFGVIAEQDIADDLWMSVEQGAHNGRMLDDHLFGAARNPEVIVPSIEQFDYYSGGGIDQTFLGMGQADAEGNVNVSHLAGNLVGPGGFIEIAQNAKKVVFCGTFDAQGSEVAFEEGRLRIVKPGKIQKLVKAVERITFSADYARKHGQEVLYVTERCVFQLDPEGLRLVEIAPGIEIERDILPFMAFRPIIRDVKRMDSAVFV